MGTGLRRLSPYIIASNLVLYLKTLIEFTDAEFR